MPVGQECLRHAHTSYHLNHVMLIRHCPKLVHRHFSVTITLVVLFAGRVDAFVSSTDKNFMVPVGGALVCS